jgi:hypothetical protein
VYIGNTTAEDEDSDNSSTVIGANSALNLVSGQGNTIIGEGSLPGLQSGSDNIAIGLTTLPALTSSSNDIIIGNGGYIGTSTVSNELDIGGTLYGNLSSGYIGIDKQSPAANLDIDNNNAVGSTTLMLDNNAGTPTFLVAGDGYVSIATSSCPHILFTYKAQSFSRTNYIFRTTLLFITAAAL